MRAPSDMFEKINTHLRTALFTLAAYSAVLLMMAVPGILFGAPQ